jgi:hypothetical protein
LFWSRKKKLSDSWIDINLSDEKSVLDDVKDAYAYASAEYNEPSAFQERANLMVKEFDAVIKNKKIPAGLVAVDKNNKKITVAYHGTEFTHGKQDAWTDVNFLPKSAQDIAIQGKAHRGFLDRYLQSKDQVEDILKNVQDKQDYSLTVTGHSLGGALATLDAADWSKKNADQKTFKSVNLTGFAAPQVFDARGANHVNALLGENALQIRKAYDPVTYQIPGLDDVGQGLVLSGIHYTSAENHFLKNFDLEKKELSFKRPGVRVKDRTYSRIQDAKAFVDTPISQTIANQVEKIVEGTEWDIVHPDGIKKMSKMLLGHKTWFDYAVDAVQQKVAPYVGKKIASHFPVAQRLKSKAIGVASKAGTTIISQLGKLYSKFQ